MLSKPVARATCADLIHPWTNSCSHASRDMVLISAVGNCKMFLPILLVTYILKLLKKKKINKEIIGELLGDYLQCVTVGMCTAILFIANSCAFRYLLGKFTYTTLAFFPGFFAGFSFVMFKPRLRVQILTAFSNATLETIVLKMSHSGKLPLNVYTETIFFMVTNACLMYANKVSHNLKSTWFYKPDQDDPKNDKKQFLKNLSTKTKKYFGLGLAYGILRILIKDITVLRPTNIYKLFKISTLKPGIFASSYVAIYEITEYLLNQYFQKSKPGYALPAGFLAGISYAIDPNLPINLSVFISLIHTLYNLIDIRLLKYIPMDTIIFCLSAGTLFHVQCFFPKSISKVGSKFIKLSSGKRSDLILEAFKKLNSNVI